jgi:hypothetical protein
MAFCIKCGTKLVGENQPNGNATEGTAANANTASANPNANNGNIGVNVNNGTNGNVNANNGTNGNANRYNTPNYVAPNRQNYIPIYIMGGFLIAVIIICTTIIIVALTGGSLIVFDDGTQTTTQVSVEGETETVAEGETEAVEYYSEAYEGDTHEYEEETEAVEENTDVVEEETEAAESNGEPYDYESAIYTLIAGAYGSGWVQTTNTHDTSYMLNYTTSSAQAFTLLGQRYWQERPYVTFNYIKNIQVYKVQREYEGYYTVYISYDFDLYNSANGERVIKTEMAIDKVQWDGSKYILSEHHWNQDVAQGTYITINTFK